MIRRSVQAILLLSIGLTVGVLIPRANVGPAEASSGAKEVDRIGPVYAPSGAEDPLAVRLCAALHTRLMDHQAKCLQRPKVGFSAASLCAANLSAALAGGGVHLSEADVVRCERAVDAEGSTCRSASQLGLPYLAACDALITGRRALGDRCRSQLECPLNAQCLGAGPVDEGICAAPSPPGSPCEVAVDVLASTTRQRRAEAQHPSCEGTCVRHRCSASP